ncbi:MAG: cell division protein FtsL [Lysobacteraceae bacterium]|nr:MAG: cell division protein FtsL [Xanthomonadaceae bacterium]
MRLSSFFMLALLLAVVISALGLVHSRHRHRQLFVELTQLERERDELNIEFGRLQLEQATWADPNRIEQIATGTLGMRYPRAEELKVVAP